MSLNQQELQNLRETYKKGTLRKSDCAPTPLAQFEKWFQEALGAECDEPNAMTLSTVSGNRPSARVVLFKGTIDGGLVFYTNYLSPKGAQLSQSAFAAATFLWLPLQRQVRIEGSVEKVSDELSETYFASRPHGSQIGAVASPQGQVVHSREYLEKLFADAEKKYAHNQIIPRPSHWGGYVIKPSSWEFWQGRENRMHDRIRYRLDGATWVKERLAP